MPRSAKLSAIISIPLAIVAQTCLVLPAHGDDTIVASPSSGEMDEPVEDWTAPAVDETSVSPSAVDVTDAAQTITAQAVISDLSGVIAPVASLSNTDGTRQARAAMKLVAGTAQDGTWSVTFTIPRRAAAGAWSVQMEPLSDTRENCDGAMTTLGVVHVRNTFVRDTSAPTAGAMSVTPETVDVTRAPAVITARIALTDPAGVIPPHAGLQSLTDSPWDTGTEMTLISGSTLDGVWEAKFTLPVHHYPSDVSVVIDTISDTLGNTEHPQWELGRVAVSDTPDNDAPVVEDSHVSPGAVEVNVDKAVVTATATISDATGTRSPVANLIDAAGQRRSRATMRLISGTATSGTWQVQFTIAKGSARGTWTVTTDALVDTNGTGAYGADQTLGSLTVRNSPLKTFPVTGRYGEHTGDAYADFYTISRSGVLTLVKGGSTTSAIQAFGPTMTQATALLQIGDWSGDRRSDALVRTRDNALWIYTSGPTGALTPWKRIGSGWGSMDQLTYVGMLDGKSRFLIARQTSTGSLYRYTMTNNGLTSATKIGQGWNGMRSLMSVGDFTGDGRTDLLGIRRSDGTLWVYPGTSRATVATGRKVGQGWGGFTAAFSNGDTTGDGRLDLVGVDASGTLWRYPNTGRGSWGTVRKLGTGYGAATVIA